MTTLTRLARLSLLLLLAITTGCFKLRVRHQLHFYGDADTGTYSLSAPEAMVDESRLRELVEGLRKFSSPELRRGGGEFEVMDLTGTARMERLYDSFDCTRAPVLGKWDCSFHFEVPPEVGKLAGWSVDWQVEVPPGIEVISSNHHRVRRDGGRTYLVWFFDGNTESTADVSMIIRSPRG